jgi:ABC-type nitrate/sulfonate/bicarbonate transport system substrate-binding protein
MVASVALLSLVSPAFVGAQDVKKPLEKVRLTVPAKSLTFVPYYFGKSQRLYEKEGIDLEIIVMRPPIGVTALQAGEVDYSAAGGLSVRAALTQGRQGDRETDWKTGRSSESWICQLMSCVARRRASRISQIQTL